MFVLSPCTDCSITSAVFTHARDLNLTSLHRMGVCSRTNCATDALTLTINTLRVSECGPVGWIWTCEGENLPENILYPNRR